jgi:ParB family chromosome partitioning protein
MSANASNFDPSTLMSQFEQEAVRRLIAIALRDTGQSRRVANFLLAWHNAEENGGWNPVDLWSVDALIARDMLVVIGVIHHTRRYPNDLGFEKELKCIWELWRK